MDGNRNWQKDFTDAPKDQEPINALVATGNPDEPLVYAIASWTGEKWIGDWQEDYPDAQPVAWCYLPDIDDDIAEEYGLDVVGDDEAAA